MRCGQHYISSVLGIMQTNDTSNCLCFPDCFPADYFRPAFESTELIKTITIGFYLLMKRDGI